MRYPVLGPQTNLDVLELLEDERSEVCVLIESGEWSDLQESELTESEKEYNSLQESRGKHGKGIILAMEGRFQMADTRNANRRVYPNPIWERTLKADGKWMSRCRENKMLGELDHPKDGVTLLNRVSHMVTELRRSPNNPKEILGRLVVFDTEKGRIIKAIHEGGGRLGVSSRGKGSVVKQDGHFIVQGDFDLDTFDVVHNPSTPGAYPTVTESAEPQQEHQEITDMSRQLQILQESLTRLKKHNVSELDGAALGVISEEVETVKTALTSESFGEKAPTAAVLAVDAATFLNKLEERKTQLKEDEEQTEDLKKNDILGKPGKSVQPVKEKDDEDKDGEDGKKPPFVKESLQMRPADSKTLKAFVEALQPEDIKLKDFTVLAENCKSDAVKCAKNLTAVYRVRCGVEGKLTEAEAEAIQARAEAIVAEQAKLTESGPIKATIHFGSLTESTETFEISATSEADLRRSIEERTKGQDTGIVFVEIDRAESIVQECTDRFASLIESQVLKTAQAAEEGAAAKTELSEMSAKLAGAAQIIENLASRCKASEGNLDEAQASEVAAVEILEAIVQEFQSERLKGTVAGIAATHQVDGLAERLVECVTPQEAITTAVQHLAERSSVHREPLPGARDTALDEALAADAAKRLALQEEQRLPEKNANQGGNNPMVEATNRVVTRVQEMGGR